MRSGKNGMKTTRNTVLKKTKLNRQLFNEKVNEQARKSYYKHQTEINENRREQYNENKDKVDDRRRELYINNKDELSEKRTD